jgi:hypothetical protein
MVIVLSKTQLQSLFYEMNNCYYINNNYKLIHAEINCLRRIFPARACTHARAGNTFRETNEYIRMLMLVTVQ